MCQFQPGPGIIKRVDKKKRNSSSRPSTGNVDGQLEGRPRVLGRLERRLDCVLEGKVERLGWEEPQNIGQVSWTTTNNFHFRMVSSSMDSGFQSVLQVGKSLNIMNIMSEQFQEGLFVHDGTG